MRDPRLHHLAGRQHWLVTRSQLLGLGYTPRQIDLRLATGELVVEHRNVYAVGGSPKTFEQKVLAACLASGGVASHRSAAALFGLRGIKPRDVEITVDRSWLLALEGVTIHRRKQIEATRIGVIPVTMPMPTLLDLAAVEQRLVEGAVNHALGKGLVRLPRLVRYVDGVTVPGKTRMREVIEAQIKGGASTESWLEDQLVELMRRYGLPDPVRQYRLKGMRFDLAYPEVSLDIEADSRLWHSTPADRRRDAARDAAAAALGWAVERVTWLQIAEEPGVVAARIRRWLQATNVAA
jgi:very-short-patch-repair endonuclease